MERSLRLVPPAADRQTVELLTRLLAEARAGRVVGIAYVALHPQHGYSADLVGQALQSPLLVRGICRTLEEAIARKIR